MPKIQGEALTFNDVMLVPRKTENRIENISLKTRLTDNITLNAPLISSPMDIVTESRMAIAIARQGGIGLIHKDLSIEEQSAEVDKVKRSEYGVIKSPISLNPNRYVYEAEELMKKYRISGIPITEFDRLVGIITNRDLRFEEDYDKKIYEVMTRENLITARVGTDFEQAKIILDKHKIEKLPIVDDNGDLKGLITTKDIMKAIEYPNSAKDKDGALLVGAAVEIAEDMIERVDELVKCSVDIIAIDSPHGHTSEVIEAIRQIKMNHPNLPIIAGNVVTAEGVKDLIDAGADVIRVGVGSSSASDLGVVSGVGMPQITAIIECTEEARKHGIAVISDGGIKASGDVVKAIAAGASAVMMGSMLVERRKEHKDYAKELITQIIENIKTGMHYCGVTTIEEMKKDAHFVKITPAGYNESLPHKFEASKEYRNTLYKRY